MELALRAALVDRLKPFGFTPQRDGTDLIFNLHLVRPSYTADLFERIELQVSESRNDAIVLSMAVAVVERLETRFKGLTERGDLSELCTEPETSRVHFASASEFPPWLERFGEIAPDRVRRLAHERGDDLLARTASARAAAHDAFHRFVDRGDVPAVTPEQRDAVANAVTWPLVIGTDGPRKQYIAAVTALVRANDAEIIRLGNVAALVAKPMDFIEHGKSVPAIAHWKIRILVDLILRAERSTRE